MHPTGVPTLKKYILVVAGQVLGFQPRTFQASSLRAIVFVSATVETILKSVNFLIHGPDFIMSIGLTSQSNGIYTFMG